PIRALSIEHRLDPLDDSSRLHRVRRGPDYQVDIGLRNPQVAEERARHRIIVVLPGVDDGLHQTCPGRRAMHWSKLREIGASPDDVQELHLTERWLLETLGQRVSLKCIPVTKRW